jgi:hypothetical protein
MYAYRSAKHNSADRLEDSENLLGDTRCGRFLTERRALDKKAEGARRGRSPLRVWAGNLCLCPAAITDIASERGRGHAQQFLAKDCAPGGFLRRAAPALYSRASL